MKKIMIVGASAWQVPAIKKAKELGYEVGVVDYNPNAIGIQYADAFFNVSTNDKEGVCRATKEYNADGITSVATDMPMRAIAYTCEMLGLNGISVDTAYKATDKLEMIRAFEKCGVPHPWFFVVENRDISKIRDKIKYPCICKPTDNSASRGVVKVNSQSELDKAIEYSSKSGRSGTVLVEECLIGHEVSVEAFAVNKEYHILAITDKLTTGAPYFVEMGHSQPSNLPPEVQNEIKKVAKDAMKAIGIDNGPAHIEIMVTKEGAKMIELGARLGGDFITTDLVPLSVGIDMLGATIKLAAGDQVDITPRFEHGSAVRYMTSENGIINSVDGLEKASESQGVHRVEMLKQIGEQATEIKNSLDRVGYIIAQGSDADSAIKNCEKAMEFIRVNVD